METISLKALAQRVLERNQQGNSMETKIEIDGNFMETSTDLLVSLYYSTSLESLSTYERALFDDRLTLLETDMDLPKERAESEAIKQITRERVIPGKCDKCYKVNGCMLTRSMREHCEVV